MFIQSGKIITQKVQIDTKKDLFQQDLKLSIFRLSICKVAKLIHFNEYSTCCLFQPIHFMAEI